MCQLVRDRIITFNWKQMRWTFNIDELPRHTTGIDGFLGQSPPVSVSVCPLLTPISAVPQTRSCEGLRRELRSC